ARRLRAPRMARPHADDDPGRDPPGRPRPEGPPAGARAAARPRGRRPDRGRAARGRHGRGRAPVRVGPPRGGAARLARAPGPAAGQLRAVAAEQAALASQVRVPRLSGARAPRRSREGSRHRGARARRPPLRLPSRRLTGDGVPGPADGPRRARRGEGDGGVDQQPRDRRPRRRRARRDRRGHERGLRVDRRRGGRRLVLRGARQRGRHDDAGLRRPARRHRIRGRPAVPPRVADQAAGDHPGRPPADRPGARPGARARERPAARGGLRHRQQPLALPARRDEGARHAAEHGRRARRPEPLRVRRGRRPHGRRPVRREVPGRPHPGRQPAARRAELPLQPPHRRLRHEDRRGAARLSDGHRRLPVPLELDHRAGRAGDDAPGDRRHRARAAARLRRAHGSRRPRLPEGHGRLAVLPGGAVGRRPHGGHHARGLPLRVEDAGRSGLPGRVALLPPRPAGHGQLRRRRHPARRAGRRDARAAPGGQVPPGLPLAGRRRLLRHRRGLRRDGRRRAARPRRPGPRRRPVRARRADPRRHARGGAARDGRRERRAARGLRARAGRHLLRARAGRAGHPVARVPPATGAAPSPSPGPGRRHRHDAADRRPPDRQARGLPRP
ncbi:MAG: hypothetical protein AVDCRST_MAG57-1307, partial [uncultured Blastococcus sp.]